MITEPKIEAKAEQPYAAISLWVAQSEIPNKAPPLIGDVIAWVKAHGGATSGPPFFDYVEFKPGGTMRMLVGMPTKALMAGDDQVVTGSLPGGRYATVTHTGPYHELGEANMALDKWARDQGIALDGSVAGDTFQSATRLEIYHKDPDETPGSVPTTEVAFRLAD